MCVPEPKKNDFVYSLNIQVEESITEYYTRHSM